MQVNYPKTQVAVDINQKTGHLSVYGFPQTNLQIIIKRNGVVIYSKVVMGGGMVSYSCFVPEDGKYEATLEAPSKEALAAAKKLQAKAA